MDIQQKQLKQPHPTMRRGRGGNNRKTAKSNGKNMNGNRQIKKKWMPYD